ncbi:hypothetical protein D3C85_1947940 [compost metagenome]
MAKRRKYRMVGSVMLFRLNLCSGHFFPMNMKRFCEKRAVLLKSPLNMMKYSTHFPKKKRIQA